MARVDFIRTEVAIFWPIWEMIKDVITGEWQVKRKRDLYLPRPNAADTSKANKLRYEAYLKRAVFFNVTKRTLSGLVGMVFMRDPVANLPASMQFLLTDASGSGLSLVQMAKRAVQFTVAYGRCGLFVDYPKLNGPTTVKAQQEGYVRPTITLFAPRMLYNWRTVTMGGKVQLSLVVMEETFIAQDDGFEAQEGQQFRVMRLVALSDALQTMKLAGVPADTPISVADNTSNDMIVAYTPMIYQVEIWRKQNGAVGHSIFQIYWPVDNTGAWLDFIPFTFIGSENNDADVDNPPLYDLAAVNIAHYRNSADYEDAINLVGQPTPVLAGLAQDWVENVLHGSVSLGSRAAIPLPVGATAQLLQASPNTMVKEGMDAKEKQMVALGAKLIEAASVPRTATEAQIDQTSERSALSSCAQNVEHAITQALKWAGNFIGGVDADDITYSLNTEFDLTKMSPQEMQAVVAAWQADALAKTEMRQALTRGGYATLNDDDFAIAVQEQKDEDVANMAAMTAAMPPPPMPPQGTVNENEYSEAAE